MAADLFVMATDVDGVYLHWGTPRQRRLGQVTPQELAGYEFAAGSMGPKVEAAARFAAKTGRARRSAPWPTSPGSSRGQPGPM